MYEKIDDARLLRYQEMKMHAPLLLVFLDFLLIVYQSVSKKVRPVAKRCIMGKSNDFGQRFHFYNAPSPRAFKVRICYLLVFFFVLGTKSCRNSFASFISKYSGS